MDIKQITNYVVSKIKQREQFNKDKAKEFERSGRRPSTFDRAINFNIDYKYLAEVIEEGFKVGLFVMPKTEEELNKFESDIYSNFIEEDVFPSNIEFVRDSKNSYYSLPTLARMVEKMKNETEKFPYPEYKLRVNLDDIISANPDEVAEILSNGAYVGCARSAGGYGSFHDKELNYWKFDKNYGFPFSGYYFVKSSWIKGKINLKLTIPESTELNEATVNKLCQFLQSAKEKSGFELGEIDISFGQRKVNADETRYRFNVRKIAELTRLNDKVNSMGGKVYFAEFNDTFSISGVKWNLDQVKKANTYIDYLADIIKKNKLTPFEAVLYICAWSSRYLRYNNNEINLELNNTILSAVNNQYVRCVGYSEFINAVLNAAGFSKNNSKDSKDVLYAEKISCTVGKDESGNIIPNHCQSLIHIKDEKYGINGNYICDANAANFIDDLTKQINAAISGLNNGKTPNIKPFNSLCLKNLDEYRAILPNYRIFPYSGSDEAEISYDRQISARDIPKFQRIAGNLEHKTFAETDEYLKNNNINFSVKPIEIDGVEYGEYIKASNEIMKNLKKTQGKSISHTKFTEAYLKVILLLYPELANNEESLSVYLSGVDLMNKSVSEFIKESYFENQFSVE